MKANPYYWRLFGLSACLVLSFELPDPCSAQAQERKVVEVKTSDLDRLERLLTHESINAMERCYNHATGCRG